MKRVKVVFLAPNEFEKQEFLFVVKGVLEVEKYEEKRLSREHDVLDDHSFGALWESALEFANGLWCAFKGFWGMAKWSVVLVVEGFRWLWVNGAGKEKGEKK